LEAIEERLSDVMVFEDAVLEADEHRRLSKNHAGF
jgi:hypothetical protein